MMKVYFGFDDTDNNDSLYGTGKLVRWFTRNMPNEILVEELQEMAINVVSMERDAMVPAPDDVVVTNGWLRPRLIGYQPVLFVYPNGKGRWKNIYWKRKKNNHSEKSQQHRPTNRIA